MNDMKERVLVIAAHPDDEVLGAGGAVARYAEEGATVAVLILGEGVASRQGLAPSMVKKEQEQLRTCTTQAAQILSIPEPIIKQLPDNQFDTVPLLSIVHTVEDVVKEFRPTLVYTHHHGDVNVDHRLTAEATEAAVRPQEGLSVREVRAFEIPSSSEWNFIRPVFRPNIFVTLSEGQLKKKLDALGAYGPEMRFFPHPRSHEYITALAHVRGAQGGFRAAEAFALVYRRV